MRLIDADSEIEKINSEIERIEEKIKVWKERESLNDAGMYDVGMKIASLRKNITNCKMEIAMLRSYSTAFDVDEVVQQLEQLKMRYFLIIANTGDKKLDVAYENVGNALDGIIEIVKDGGVE
nr:MAG TPA: hypothetical protein [Caudoviricetes sp.]